VRRAAFARPVRRYFFLLLSVLAFAPAVSRAAEATFQVTADRNATSVTTGETTYTGHARLVDGDLTIEADEIRANLSTKLAVARGQVTVTRGTLRLLADEISYNGAIGAFSGKNVRGGDAPLFLSGSALDGTRDKITLHDAQVSYTEPGRWAPTLAATSLTYQPVSRTLRTEDARIRLGWLPPLRLPSFDRPVNDPLFGAVLLRGGYRSSLGAFLDGELLAPVASGVRLGGDLGLYTGRGVLFGPAAEVKIERPGFSLTDSLRGGFIHDNGNRGLDILARPVRADRGFLEWRHREEIGDRLTLFGQLSYWSDSEVFRDFRATDFYPVQVPDTFFETDYASVNSITSVFLRAQPNAFFQTQRRLPEFRYDQLPTPVALGAYGTFAASVAVLSEDKPTPGPARSSTRFDAVYELTRPFTPREWLTFRPVIGARLTHYADTIGGRSSTTRGLGEVGADAELHASATSGYQNERWGINGLRHLITPTLSYRYIPGGASGAAFIPAVDRAAFSTYLQPLGLMGGRDIDRLYPTNTLRFGLGNSLQTRADGYGSRDLASLNFAADWRLSRQPGQRPFSAIQSEFAVMPASWLRLDAFTRMDPRNAAVRELNTGLTLRDGDAWWLRVGNDFLERQLRDYSMDVGWQLDEAHTLRARLRYDARLSRFTEQSYGLSQTLDNLWLLHWVVTLYDGPRRESSFGLGLEVELKRF
jgi:LPS-assembly protein